MAEEEVDGLIWWLWGHGHCLEGVGGRCIVEYSIHFAYKSY